MAASVPCYPVGQGCVFQVPNVTQTDAEQPQRKTTYVAVLDASPSMALAWRTVARSINAMQDRLGDFHSVTFDSDFHMKYGKLSEALHDNAGVHGGTNIREGLVGLQKVITRLRKEGCDSFLVIFVSDGQDTWGNTPQQLTALAEGFDSTGMEFTSVGVGRYFPTQLSMALRNAFHRGRVNLPNLTLVENAQDFDRIFADLVAGIVGSDGSPTTVAPPVRVAPWMEPTNQILEKTWVVLDEMTDTIELEGKELKLVPSKWSVSVGEAAMKQWINMLHALSTSGQDIRGFAQASLQLGQQITKNVEEAEKVALETIATSNRCPSVYQRLRKKLRSLERGLGDLERELKKLAAGDVLSQLSDADLAKRLAIGMQQGKHHKRALEWKGVGLEDFRSYLARFQTLIDNHLEALRNGPEDENRSAVSLESNGDVLLQEDLPTAISELPSQYYLVECVPVIGQPVVIKTTNASMINPWMVKVKSVSRHTPMLDTCSLLELADSEGIAHLSLGGGQTEAVNAICPLVTKETAPTIGPFMRSKLYQMLMTHTVCKNIDTIDPDSHPALLAALVCNLLLEPKSTWREELIAKVLDTMKGLYINRGSFKDSAMSLEATPNLAVVTESPDLATKCQSMSKPLLLTMCIAQDLDVPQKIAIIERMYLEHIGRVVNQDHDCLEWFNVSGGPGDIEFKFEDLGLDVKKFLTWPKFRKSIQSAVADLMKNTEGKACDDGVSSDLGAAQIKVELRHKKLEFTSKLEHDPVNFEVLEAFSEWLVGKDGIPSIAKEVFVAHGCTHKKSYDRATHEVIDWDATRRLVINLALASHFKSRIARMTQKMVEEGEALYTQHFNETHQECILPMTWEEICQKRAELGLDAVDKEALGYDDATGMCRRACMSPKCDFFLVPTKSLGNHLEGMRKAHRASGVDAFIKAFHRCIMSMRHKSDEEIEAACASGAYIQRPPPVNYRKAFEGAWGPKLRSQIALIKQKYVQIYG